MILPVPELMKSHQNFLSYLHPDSWVHTIDNHPVASVFPSYVLRSCEQFYTRKKSDTSSYAYQLTNEGQQYLNSIRDKSIVDPSAWNKKSVLLTWYLENGGDESLALNYAIKYPKLILEVADYLKHPVPLAMIDAKSIDNYNMRNLPENPVANYRMRGGTLSAFARQMLGEISDKVRELEMQKSTRSKKGGVGIALEYAIVLTYCLMQTGTILKGDDDEV